MPLRLQSSSVRHAWPKASSPEKAASKGRRIATLRNGDPVFALAALQLCSFERDTVLSSGRHGNASMAEGSLYHSMRDVTCEAGAQTCRAI